MTAKEMFEKLGYKNDKNFKNALGYIKEVNNVKKYITFIDCGTSKFFTIIEGDRINPTIDGKELQAINQQCKELRWFDEY